MGGRCARASVRSGWVGCHHARTHAHCASVSLPAVPALAGESGERERERKRRAPATYTTTLPALAADEALNNHMGLFLQKTNIVRDYLEDIMEEPAPR